MTSTDQSHDNSVELFLSTEPYKLNYNGPCSVDIKMLSKMFVIEPVDKNTNTIEISLYSHFIQHKNILCNLSSAPIKHVVLVFPTVDACKAVYDIIAKYQMDVKQEVQDHSYFQLLKEQVFLPLLNEAKSNSALNERSKDFIINLLQDIVAAEQEIIEESNVKSEMGESFYSALMASNKESSASPCDSEPVDLDAEHSLKEYRYNEPVGRVSLEPADSRVSAVGDGQLTKESNVKSELDETFYVELNNRSNEFSISPETSEPVDMDVKFSIEEYQRNGSVVAVIPVPSSIDDPPPAGVDNVQEVLENTSNNSRKRCKSPESANTIIKQCKTEIPEEESYQSTFVPPPTQSETSTLIMQTKKIVKSSQFIIHKLPIAGQHRYQLFLFLSEEKNLCYRYFFETKNRRFMCINCHNTKHFVVGHLRCAENGEYSLELGLMKHKCLPDVYTQTPGEMIVSCTFYQSLFFNKKEIKHRRNQNKPAGTTSTTDTPTAIEPTSVQNPTTAEQPASSSEASSCGNATTGTIESAESNGIIKAPDFKISTVIINGTRRLELTIFATPDHSLCYTFYHDYKHYRFICKKCRNQRHDYPVFLRTRQGEDYIELNKKSQHVCEPIPYQEETEFLSTNEYEIALTHDGHIQPIVYDSNDNNLYYSFSFKSKTAYVCDGCKDNSTFAALNVKKHLDGRYTVSWKDEKSVHSCQPKRINDNDDKVLMPDKFKFFKEDDSSYGLKMATFAGEERNVHIYKYYKILDCFCCTKCLEADHFAYANVFITTKNVEYVIERGRGKHVCDPVPYSDFDTSNLVCQQSSGLHAKKFNEKLWNEKTLILAGNFEFQRNIMGSVHGLLVIFTSKERHLCYKYSFVCQPDRYGCCLKSCKVGAKVIIDEEGKHFVKLSPFKHRCEPTPYEPAKRIVRKPDYIYIATPPIKLIVFTSSSHQECYVYTSNAFYCRKCVNLRRQRNVFASMFTDENGEECFFLSRTQHICQPQKFATVAAKFGIQQR